MPAIQAPSIILPILAPLGNEVETVNNLVTHTSIEFPVEYLQEKQIHIIASEVVLVPGVPGALWCWIELSPFPSVNNLMWPAPLPATGAYWAAIGGGGGAYYQATGLLPPVAPLVEVGLGVDGAVHSILLPWVQHSAWARLVIQTPILNPTAFWLCQCICSAKG